MKTLEEAIKHCEEVAEELDMKAGFETDNERYAMSESEREQCKECANEHRQLAEWLRELRTLKQNMERQIKGAEEEIEDEYKKTPLDIEKIRTIQIYKECLKDVLYNEMDGVAEPYKADMR